MKKLLLFLQKPYLASLYTSVIVVLCFMPSEHISGDVNDKFAHFVAFAGVSFSWLWVKPNFATVIALTIVLGFFIEFIQGQLPEGFHRGYELLDGLADCVGAILGAGLYYISQRLLKFWV
ncbi:MAG: VanZ family protein [Psychromonas sp.]|jgi:VanZ family protein